MAGANKFNESEFGEVDQDKLDLVRPTIHLSISLFSHLLNPPAAPAAVHHRLSPSLTNATHPHKLQTTLVHHVPNDAKTKLLVVEFRIGQSLVAFSQPTTFVLSRTHSTYVAWYTRMH